MDLFGNSANPNLAKWKSSLQLNSAVTHTHRNWESRIPSLVHLYVQSDSGIFTFGLCVSKKKYLKYH